LCADIENDPVRGLAGLDDAGGRFRRPGADAAGAIVGCGGAASVGAVVEPPGSGRSPHPAGPAWTTIVAVAMRHGKAVELGLG